MVRAARAVAQRVYDHDCYQYLDRATDVTQKRARGVRPLLSFFPPSPLSLQTTSPRVNRILDTDCSKGTQVRLPCLLLKKGPVVAGAASEDLGFQPSIVFLSQPASQSARNNKLHADTYFWALLSVCERPCSQLSYVLQLSTALHGWRGG